MFNTKKKNNLELELTEAIADFLVEDFRFRRSFLSAINKLYPEEAKKYESSYVFHQNKIIELSKKAKLQLVTFDGQEYNEGLPVTPLNADEFSSVDNLVVFQTIEPTIVTNNGDIVHQGTIILAEKE